MRSKIPLSISLAFLFISCLEPSLTQDKALYEKGKIAFEQKSFSQALHYFQTMRQEHPYSARLDDALFYIGESYLEIFQANNIKPDSTQLDSALKYYRLVPQLSTKFLEARFGQLKTLYTQGKKDSIFTELNTLLKQYPNHSMADNIYLYLGNYYQYIKKNPDSALSKYQTIITHFSQSGSYDNALLAVAQLYNSYQYTDSAQYWYQKLINERPLSSKADNACLEIAQIYRKKATYWIQNLELDSARIAQNQSLYWYRKIIQNYPQSSSSPKAHYWIGDYFYTIQTNNSTLKDSAIFHFKKYLQIELDSTDTKKSDAQNKLMKMGIIP